MPDENATYYLMRIDSLINGLLLMTSLVELFRKISCSFLDILTVRTDAYDAYFKTVWNIFAAMRFVASCRQEILVEVCMFIEKVYKNPVTDEMRCRV